MAGGKYKELIKHMEIIKAKGTVLDYVMHSRLIKAKEELRRTYMETVCNLKLIKTL